MTLTIEDVQRATCELLEEYGTDYRYELDVDSFDSCTYGPQDGGPDGCLIGLIAKKLDEELYQRLLLADVDGSSVWYDPTKVTSWDQKEQFIRTIVGTGHIKGPNNLVNAMRDAQAAQDLGKPWGEAAQYILELEATA